MIKIVIGAKSSGLTLWLTYIKGFNMKEFTVILDQTTFIELAESENEAIEKVKNRIIQEPDKYLTFMSWNNTPFDDSY